MSSESGARNVVLVHGGFVDGSGWQAVHDLLTKDGYRVAIVQNPTLSLEDDAAVTRRVIDELDGPVVLVGHSYGGAVITEAGLHEKVAALVYIAAFAPDKGESVNTLIADPPPGAPVPPILPHSRYSDQLSIAGCERAWRNDKRSLLADQAKLVPGRRRRPDDPSARPAGHVRTGRLNHDRSRRQPLHLPVPARSGSRPHHPGCDRNPRVSSQAATRLTRNSFPCRAAPRRPAGGPLVRMRERWAGCSPAKLIRVTWRLAAGCDQRKR